MGKNIKRTVKTVIFITIIVFLLFAATPAYAYSNPDSWSILSKKVFRNLVTNNDFLAVFEYNLTYSSIPTATVDRLFLFSLLSQDTITNYGDTRVVAYHSSGYGYGLGYIYCNPASAPAWDSNLKLRIMEDPAAFPSPLVIYSDIGTDDYDSSTTTAEAKLALGNYLITLMTDIGTNWSTSLTTNTDLSLVLTITGETYIRTAIPSIVYLAPQILNIQSLTLSPVTENTTNVIPDRYKNQYTGTAIEPSLTGITELLHTDWQMGTGVALLALWIWCAYYSNKKWQRAEPGMVGGGLVFIGGSVMGFVSWQIFAVGVLMLGYYFAFVYAGDKA